MLEPAIHKLAMSEGNEAAVAAARQISGKEHSLLFEAKIALLFIGHYALMGTGLKDVQCWCVD